MKINHHYKTVLLIYNFMYKVDDVGLRLAYGTFIYLPKTTSSLIHVLRWPKAATHNIHWRTHATRIKKKKRYWLPLKWHPVAEPLEQHYLITFLLTFERLTEPQRARSPTEF